MKTFKEILEEKVDPKSFKRDYKRMEMKLDNEIQKEKDKIDEISKQLEKYMSGGDTDKAKKLYSELDKTFKKIKELENSKYDKLQKFYVDYTKRG